LASLRYKSWKVFLQLAKPGLSALPLLIAGQLLVGQAGAKPLTYGSHDLVKLQSQIRSLDKMLFDHRQLWKAEPTPGLHSAVSGDRLQTMTFGSPRGPEIDAFNEAYANYISGNDELAISGFKLFISHFPTHPLRAKAENSLAQIYFDWDQFHLASVHHEKAKQQFRQFTGTAKEQTPTLSESRKQSHMDNSAENSKDTSSWTSDLSPESGRKPEQKRFALGTERSGAGKDPSDSKKLISDFIENVGDRIFFDTDSSVLTEASRRVLQNQARWLNNYPDLTLTLEGHSDERGTREYNLGLSARRATEARRFLRQLGISGKRIRTISYGKERPVALCDNVSCWAQNRRVVTRLNLPESAIISRSEKPDPEIRKNDREWDANYSVPNRFVHRRLREL